MKPFGSGKLTPEEEHEIRSKGGKARQRMKTTKEMSERFVDMIQQTLALPMQQGKRQSVKSFADQAKLNTDVLTKVVTKLVTDYLKTGDPRLFELIMKYGLITPAAVEVAKIEDENEGENALIMALSAKADQVWAEDKEKPAEGEILSEESDNADTERQE